MNSIETSAGTYYIPSSLISPKWGLEDIKETEEMKSKTEYKNYFYKERKNKNGPSTKLKLNLPTDYLDFHEGERSGFLSIPISCTLKEGLWLRSFEFIHVKWGMLTTIQQIENALIHITQHTKFKSLEGTHNRYTYNFNEADTALIKLLIDEVYNSKSKRINYSWIEPLQELICNREVKRIEKKKKKVGLKFKNTNDAPKWVGTPFDKEPEAVHVAPKIKGGWTIPPPSPKKAPSALSSYANTVILQQFEKESLEAVQQGRLQPSQYAELKKDLHEYLTSERRKKVKPQPINYTGRYSSPKRMLDGDMPKAKELITGTPGEPVPVTVTGGIYGELQKQNELLAEKLTQNTSMALFLLQYLLIQIG